MSSDVKSNFSYAIDKVDTSVKSIYNMYTKHPNDNGMSGIQHFLFALKLSGMTFLSGLLLLAHAITPWWFTTTGGDLLLYSADLLKLNRSGECHLNNKTDEEDNDDDDDNDNDEEEDNEEEDNDEDDNDEEE